MAMGHNSLNVAERMTGSSKNGFHKQVLDWLVPGLFALLLATTIRQHSWSPVATLQWVAPTLLGISVLALLILLGLGSRLRIRRDIAAVLVAVGASVAVSTYGSPDIVLALPRLVLYVAVALLALALYLLYRDSGRLPVTSFCVAIASIHVIFVVEASIWIAGVEPPFFQNGPRIANFVNVRHFGYVGFLAAASSLALMELTRSRYIIWIALTGTALFGIVAFGSRGALLSWILFAVLLASFGRNRKTVIIGAGIALLAVFLLVWYLHWSEILQTPNFFSRIAALVGTETHQSGRMFIWQQVIAALPDRPLFGFGPEGYSLSDCCERSYVQPHNFLLQGLLEFGLFGCALLGLLLWRGIAGFGGVRRLWVAMGSSSESVVLACLLAAYIAFCLIDGLLYHAVPLIHLALFSALFSATLGQYRGPTPLVAAPGI
jgi:O-antigen ligase